LKILNHDYIRLAFVIQDDNFEVPNDHPWANILDFHKTFFLQAVKSVGVFEIERNRRKYPSGTGWILSDDLIVTKDNMLYDFDFRHDCATLTRNSGSPVIDITTGTVIGTPFAGSLNVFEDYAVRVNVLGKILSPLDRL
jgi:hypothetical protein